MGRGTKVGVLEELMLLAVLHLGEDAHAGSIRDVLEEQAGRSVSVSTVYVTLMRLEEKGYVRSWKGEPTTERGGKAKRMYGVTARGLEVLEAMRDVRERMWRGIGVRGVRA